MEDPDELARQQRAEVEALNTYQEQALEQKTRRFVPRGFIVLAIGIVLLAIGLLLHTGVRSPEGVLVGIGILVIIIGIIQVLIGLIRPIVPDQVNRPPQHNVVEPLEDVE